MRWRLPIIALVAAGASVAHAEPTATVRLTPVCDPGSTQATALDVALSLPLEGRPRFRLDDTVFGSSGMADLIVAAEAADRRGPLPLERRMSDGALELQGARAADGIVTLRYRARSVATTTPGARYGLRHDATGIGGLGAYFLVLPDSGRAHRRRIEWGKGTCPEAGAWSSVLPGAGPLDGLRSAAYFAGRPAVVEIDEGTVHVSALWFGAPGFDVQAASRWAAGVLAAERAFFSDADPTPYHLFVRVLPEMGARANGMGQPSSLLTAIGPQTGFDRVLRRNLAHEMLHRWIGLGLRFAGPEGSHFWFTEGFTVYYAVLLAHRAGLVSSDELLAELNDVATRYFTNPRAAATNEEIRRGFFSDDELSIVPYVRGALYAAELDRAIRRRSGGKRSLDDLIRSLPRRELPAAAFTRAIRRELGAPGVARFEEVVERGGRPAPPPDAYGPCFGQEARPVGFAWVRLGTCP